MIDVDYCDNCGKVKELYYNEKTGLAFCWKCDEENPSETMSNTLSPTEKIAELEQRIIALEKNVKKLNKKVK